MNLDQVCQELIGWRAYFKGANYSPQVKVRIGSARAELSCMEIGSKTGVYASEELTITIGEWHHAGEEDDSPPEDTVAHWADPSIS